jgi:beta-lactamase superfamily II metal-dependent hydrolase
MSPSRILGAALVAACCLTASTRPAAAVAPGNGRLQIIQLDVGQGDGAVVISPQGQVVLIDEGTTGTGMIGVSIVDQIKALGVTHVDYHFASHYHQDHINNITSIINGGVPIDYGWDRSSSYNSNAYRSYAAILGSTRRTIAKDQVITLDSLSAHPVTIKCVNLAGAGTGTTDENGLSIVLKISYGEFDAEYGGDLNNTVEPVVGPQVGPVELYKVHHHGSATSTTAAWLNAITPKVAIISCGNGNSYGHPTATALTNLHNKSVKTYWTETGAGVAPNATWDKVSSGQVIVSATWEPAGVDTIRGNGFADTFTNSGTASSDAIAPVVALAAPDGGETWKVGSSRAITWTATDNVAVTTVDLAWSSNGGSSWSSVASGIANTGSYNWTVPASPTIDGRMRVTARDAAGNLGRDSSVTSFTLDYWSVTASAGGGGTVTPSGVVSVSEGSSSGFAIAAGSGFAIADVLVDGGSVGTPTSYTFNAVAGYHTLAASFRDIVAPSVALSAPAGGEAWQPGDVHAVTWTASDNVGVDSVDVDFSEHGTLGPWGAVAHGLANSGTYNWTVPPVNTDSALVRVTAYDRVRNSATATAAGMFTIGTGSADVGIAGPAILALAAPTPNPSVSATRLNFSLPQSGSARLEVLDITGRRVWASAGDYQPGPHSLVWDGRATGGGHVQAGLYLVRLITPWGTRNARFVRLQ